MGEQPPTANQTQLKVKRCMQAGDVPPASEKVAEVAAGSDVTFHWTDLTEYVNKVRSFQCSIPLPSLIMLDGH